MKFWLRVRVAHVAILMMMLICSGTLYAQPQILTVSSGTIRFYSEAPQELIKASSSALKGVLDLRHKTFIFRISIASFVGFNSPLQQEHFNENYMETSRYPEATFAGKIIEDVDLLKDGEHVIRAKGKLNIHGLQHERIIKVNLVTKGGKITVSSDFVVALADHSIKIPRMVYDKLAPDINVSVNATLVPRK